MKTLEELKNTSNLLIKQTGYYGGAGEIYQGGKPFATVIWSNGMGWDHVSIAPYNRKKTPTWDEMCRVKDMFFHDDETVVQYHPAKANYVNIMENCLHLWRPHEGIAIPPMICV